MLEVESAKIAYMVLHVTLFSLASELTSNQSLVQVLPPSLPWPLDRPKFFSPSYLVLSNKRTSDLRVPATLSLVIPFSEG